PMAGRTTITSHLSANTLRGALSLKRTSFGVSLVPKRRHANTSGNIWTLSGWEPTRERINQIKGEHENASHWFHFSRFGWESFQPGDLSKNRRRSFALRLDDLCFGTFDVGASARLVAR